MTLFTQNGRLSVIKNVRINDALYSQLKSLAYKNEMSATKYINKLLEEAIKDESKTIK